jgi:hypothetical protein
MLFILMRITNSHYVFLHFELPSLTKITFHLFKLFCNESEYILTRLYSKTCFVKLTLISYTSYTLRIEKISKLSLSYYPFILLTKDDYLVFMSALL